MASRDSMLERIPRGGADRWDDGQAGSLLTAEFFGTPPTGGLLKFWNGAIWSAKPLKAWGGSAWVVGVLKHWTGTVWKLSNT